MDYLSAIAGRIVAAAPRIGPRVRGRFEPLGAPAPSLDAPTPAETGDVGAEPPRAVRSGDRPSRPRPSGGPAMRAIDHPDGGVATVRAGGTPAEPSRPIPAVADVASEMIDVATTGARRTPAPPAPEETPRHVAPVLVAPDGSDARTVAREPRRPASLPEETPRSARVRVATPAIAASTAAGPPGTVVLEASPVEPTIVERQVLITGTSASEPPTISPSTAAAASHRIDTVAREPHVLPALPERSHEPPPVAVRRPSDAATIATVVARGAPPVLVVDDQPTSEPPSITVTIGRIDVRATAPVARTAAAREERTRVTTLADFLADARHGGAR